MTTQNYTGIERRDPNIFISCPKYDKHELSEDQIIEIAKKAVDLAREEFYQEVGKSVTSKFFVIVGISVVGIFGWLTTHGYLK